ncbi:molybdopterin oxidoreductase family protein [Falsiruegeria mediterranea]|uniref:Assimilatory nitrate reductase catalytic subunit n=1 Tax=Falsiruegeria mediterranea M17 TaxID=1200281 RepID=A0A2R8C8R6_9RHOB|nr:molybdopterin oxidoreductase family protein [Falsiruegeria mediterranea]SPJ28756.1 Assimilatory nitrate reductase catalytic subunit [Falsiruegeria mediterranea M17]
MTQPQTQHRTCNICEAMCGLIITHDATQVLSIKPDPNDPLSRGHICPKAVALQDFRTDPDRITKPLRKVNGEFVEISWDEALEFAAERIRAVQSAHDRDAVGVYLGNPNAHKFGNLLNLPSLVKAIGTSNRYSSATADQIPHHVASIHMLGHPMLIPVPDIDRTDYMLIIGGNPVVSNGSMMTAPGFGRRIEEVKARGGQVIVIDPRRTETAEKASAHHFIRPETDAFLMLAMAHVILDRGLVDLGHLADRIDGLDALKEAINPLTPALAAKHTGIAQEVIEQMALDFANAKSAVCYARMGASTQSFGSLCQWASNLLNILTGNFDAEGGAMFTTPALDYVGMTSRKGKHRTYPERRSRVSGQPLYNGEFPVSVMAEEMETPGAGQIKALVTVAGNPVLTAPNGRRIEAALEGLDFMMSIDIHLNDTTRHADLILPGTVALEEMMYDIVFHTFAVRNTAAYAPAMFAPPKGNPQEWEVIARLTAKLTGANQIGPAPEQVLSMLLTQGFHADQVTIPAIETAQGSIDLGPMVPNLAERLETPEGRLNLAPDVFLNDLPRLLDSASANTDALPYLMIGRRQVRSHNSWTQNSPRLVKGRNRCTVQINPVDATRLGIEDESDVQVTGRVGSVTLPAEITDAMAPGVVSIPQGWGQRNGKLSAATQMQTVSINDLTDDLRIDPISGNAAFNGVPVALAAAD